MYRRLEGPQVELVARQARHEVSSRSPINDGIERPAVLDVLRCGNGRTRLSATNTWGYSYADFTNVVNDPGSQLRNSILGLASVAGTRVKQGEVQADAFGGQWIEKCFALRFATKARARGAESGPGSC